MKTRFLNLLKVNGAMTLIATTILPAMSFATPVGGGYLAEDPNVLMKIFIQPGAGILPGGKWPRPPHWPGEWPWPPGSPWPEPASSSTPTREGTFLPESPTLLNGGLGIVETDAAVPARPGGSIGVTRRYNSKVWAYASSGPFLTPDGHYSNTCLSRINRMGLGWDFHPAKIVKDKYSNNYVYIDGQGGVHVLYEVPPYDYPYNYETRDGTYINGSGDWTSLKTKSGVRLSFVSDNYNCGKEWNLFEVTDTYGNRINYYYAYLASCWAPNGELLGDALDSIVSSSGQKIIFFYDYEPAGYKYGALDSLQTLGPNGEWQTVKYEYYPSGITISNPWTGNFYDENSEAIQNSSVTLLALKKVTFPNNTSEEYSYDNGYGELTTIRKSSGEKINYTYDSYTYNTGTEERKTRHISRMTISPDDGTTNYPWTYDRNVPPGYVGPDKVTVTAPDNISKTEYIFNCGLPSSTPINSIDNGVLLGQTVLSQSNEILTKSQYGYLIRNSGKELLADSVATIIGSKKYVTRYRNYDAFGNPQRIEELGDVGTTSDDRYIYKEYLHNQTTSQQPPAAVVKIKSVIPAEPYSSALFGPQNIVISYDPKLKLTGGYLKFREMKFNYVNYKWEVYYSDSIALTPALPDSWVIYDWTMHRDESSDNEVKLIAECEGFSDSRGIGINRLKMRPLLPYYQESGQLKAKMEVAWALAPGRYPASFEVVCETDNSVTNLTDTRSGGACTLVVNVPASGIIKYHAKATETITDYKLLSNTIGVLAPSSNYLILYRYGAEPAPTYIIKINCNLPPGEGVVNGVPHGLHLYRNGRCFHTFTDADYSYFYNGYCITVQAPHFGLGDEYQGKATALYSGLPLSSNIITIPPYPIEHKLSQLSTPTEETTTSSTPSTDTPTSVTNYYLNQHIVDRVTREYIKDPLTSEILSDVRYYYDEPECIVVDHGYLPPKQWVMSNSLPATLSRIARWKGGTDSVNTEFRYDPFGNLVQTITHKNPSSTETIFSRFAPTSAPDKYQYTFPWRTVSYLENGDSLFTTTEYDTATGLPLSVTDANGYTTYYNYDLLGRLTKVARPGDWNGSWLGWTSAVTPSVIHHYYDEIFPLKRSVVDSVKLTQLPLLYLQSKTFYDGFGRPIQIQKKSPDGYAIIVNTAYDALSRVEKVSNPIKTTTTFGTYVTTDYWSSQPKKIFCYDALDRSRKVVHQDGTRDSVAYFENRVTSYDALNHSATVIKNSFGSADTLIDALNNLIFYTYDHLGRLLTVTDACSKVTKKYYDILGRLKGADIPDASSPYYYDGNSVDALIDYDNLGNVICKKNAKGVINYTYDNLSRLVKVDSAGVDKQYYLYDTYVGSNFTPSSSAWNNPKGRLTMMVNVNSDTTFLAYDNLGRIRERVFSYIGMTSRKAVKYEYNSADVCTALFYPNASSPIKYKYGSTGRLDSIPGFVSTIDYNPIDLPVQVNFANGELTNYNYDDLLRTTKVASKIGTNNLFKIGYQFYPDGNVKDIIDSLNFARNQSFVYDVSGRLTSASVSGQNLSYTYDNVGNQLTETVSGAETNYHYIYGTNKLEYLTGAKGNNFTYDELGNITSTSDGKSYTYDYANQLTKFAFSSTTGDFAYNAGGLRIKKRVTTTTVVPGEPYQTASIPESYEDLTYKAPDGDSLHDNARDLGQIKFHMNPNFLFFEIEHKYLYGTNQGDYSKIFISLDIDTIPGSGNTYFPENTNTQLLPEAAWEYCIYINSETDYGIYDSWYTKIANPFQMQVNFIPSNQGKVKIKVPKSIVGNPSYVRFVIMTTKPGFVNTDSLNNGTSTATDVAPGGANAVEGGIIYKYVDYMPPLPGTVVTTIKTTYYIYEGNQVLCELASNGNVTAKYIYGLGQMISKVDNGKHFYTSDVLGSSRVITNNSGIIEQKCYYYPFGAMLSDSGSATVANYLFTGKEWDAEESLYYYGARYYEPGLGRFYSLDPIGSSATSPYAYCANNPLRYTDPTGMVKEMVYPVYENWSVPGWGGGFGMWRGSMRSYMEAHPEFYEQVLENVRTSRMMSYYAQYDYFRTVDLNTGTITERYWNAVFNVEATKTYTYEDILKNQNLFALYQSALYEWASQQSGQELASVGQGATAWQVPEEPGLVEDWTPYFVMGGALAGGARLLQIEVNVFSKGNIFKIISKTLRKGFRIDPAHHGKPWGHPHFWGW